MFLQMPVPVEPHQNLGPRRQRLGRISHSIRISVRRRTPTGIVWTRLRVSQSKLAIHCSIIASKYKALLFSSDKTQPRSEGRAMCNRLPSQPEKLNWVWLYSVKPSSCLLITRTCSIYYHYNFFSLSHNLLACDWFDQCLLTSILYPFRCRCADGYMGPRCEYKNLDGTYLRKCQSSLLFYLTNTVAIYPDLLTSYLCPFLF